MLMLFFFFSSRRRHTRYWRDWSSDVCSSDLREVEVAQDAALGLGGQVHQGVAADEHVEARDRRVFDEVVAAEDEAAPEVGAERVALVGALEVALEQLRRHAVDFARAVRGRARDVERI